MKGYAATVSTALKYSRPRGRAPLSFDAGEGRGGEAPFARFSWGICGILGRTGDESSKFHYSFVERGILRRLNSRHFEAQRNWEAAAIAIPQQSR